MGQRPSRGNTQRERYESYRIDAIDYVNNRDAKIAEVVADIRGKYPRLPEAEARRIVAEHWAGMEAANDVGNMVRSEYLGYDERAMIGRLNERVRTRITSNLDNTLQAALRGPKSRRPVIVTAEVHAAVTESLQTMKRRL